MVPTWIGTCALRLGVDRRDGCQEAGAMLAELEQAVGELGLTG